jgi:hypothetical protein
VPKYSECDLGKPSGVFISAEGLEKCGKTWSILHTAPCPLVFISCDRDNRRAVQSARAAGRSILWSGQYIFVPSPNQIHVAGQKDDDDILIENGRRMAPLWAAIHRDFMDALQDPQVKTVVLDSGTSAYNMARVKCFGKVNGVGVFKYTKTNAIFGELIGAAQASGKVVIMVHRLEDAWGPDGKGGQAKTGAYQAQGFKDINFEVDAIIRHSKVGTDFQAKLMMEGVGRGDISGKVFKGDELDYTSIVAKLTRTKVEKWL